MSKLLELVTDRESWLATVKLTELMFAYLGPSQVALEVKNPPANAGDMRGGFDPLVGKIPWKRAWQPTPVILACLTSLWGLKTVYVRRVAPK